MKILYVTTISNTVNAFLIPHIQILIDQGHRVDVAFNIEQEVKIEIQEMCCKVHVIPFQRSPLKRDNHKAYKLLKNTISTEKYDIVHTHTPVASVIVRLICKNIKTTRVFYTAHGFHFYKGSPIKSWLVYYPLEKWLSNYTDTLITINREDYDRAKSKFKAKKIEYIPGVGFDIGKFSNVIFDRESKQKELGIPTDDFILLSVGELNKNKNHEVVIRTLAKLNNIKVHYLICGQGVLEDWLRELVQELGLVKQVHLLGFRKDIAEICDISDIFIFPSLREGLPVSLMEAMACGVSVIASNIRGNSDLIENGKGGYLVQPDNTDEFLQAMGNLISNKELRCKFGKHNQKKAREYSIENIINYVDKIYN